MINICPACETGRLQPKVADQTFSYDGATLEALGIQYSQCPVCLEEVVLPEQSKHNDVAYADAKRAHMDYFCSSQIRAWRGALGLSQQDSSLLLGGGANAFSKYERGEVMQSRPMDLLMRVCGKFPEVLPYLADRAGLKCNRMGWETIYSESSSEEPETADVVHLTRSFSEIIPAYQVANEGSWQTEADIETTAHAEFATGSRA